MSLIVDAEPAVPASWLTPRPARLAPVHRWFVFPHSYAPELVNWLLDRLDAEPDSVVLDPFCGAGTTLVEAQRRGFDAIGFDLLPLSILASRAKTQQLGPGDVRKGRAAMLRAAARAVEPESTAPVLDRAFDPIALARLSAGLRTAEERSGSDALQLAVLAIARRFSRLVADGGWLRNVEPELPADDVPAILEAALDQVAEDAELVPSDAIRVEIADARSLPLEDASVDVVVTSPPYPNRHDYTRVFAVELELAFELGEEVKELRYSALSSHPEARSEETVDDDLPELAEQVALVSAEHADPRIPRMLNGYFGDLTTVLSELHRVLVPGGRAAFVVGNAQYCGVSIPVDEHLARIGEQHGFELDGIEILRLRGNSAQQMALHGRRASRESVVQLRRHD